MQINIEVSCGELIDKMTILSIKSEKIKDKNKVKNINKEFNLLEEIADTLKNKNVDKFKTFYDQLKRVNSELWDIEDQIRILEKNKDFGDNFIQLARNVYIYNDKRFQIKNEVNDFFSSSIKEEKQYEKY